MSSYRINPAGVDSVLKTTQSDAEKFGTILTPLSGAVESAAGGTGNSGAICPALQSFFENQSKHLDAINRRVSASLNGALKATQAYIDGDIEMVGEYQREAVAASMPPVNRPANRGVVAY